MTSIMIVAGLLLVLVILLALEYARHKANLKAIPIRIHVNGTRGKSSVTRLATWALNEAGIRTFGKTTGTLPRMIFPSGREYPVYRPGGHSNVLEQVRIVNIARSHNAEAVIMECMALQPRLQWLSEQKLVQATHSVMTNARADHLDVMGPTERDVALALAATVARNQHFFTAERRHLDVFEMACKDRNCKLHPTTLKDVEAIDPKDMAGFSYHEHEENVALVLNICKELGIDRETAMRGMWKAVPDEGALGVSEVEFFGRRLYFVNGFAANDPESTERIWRIYFNRFPVERKIAVFNCRADRQHRSLQLGEAYAKWPQADSVLLMGSGTHVFAEEATKGGVDPSHFVHAEDTDAPAIFETLVQLSGHSSVIVGMANIAGEGLKLVHYFQNRSVISGNKTQNPASIGVPHG